MSVSRQRGERYFLKDAVTVASVVVKRQCNLWLVRKTKTRINIMSRVSVTSFFDYDIAERLLTEGVYTGFCLTVRDVISIVSRFIYLFTTLRPSIT